MFEFVIQTTALNVAFLAYISMWWIIALQINTILIIYGYSKLN